MHKLIRSHSGGKDSLTYQIPISRERPESLRSFMEYLIAMIPLLSIILRPRAGMRLFFQGSGKLLSS